MEAEITEVDVKTAAASIRIGALPNITVLIGRESVEKILTMIASKVDAGVSVICDDENIYYMIREKRSVDSERAKKDLTAWYDKNKRLIEMVIAAANGLERAAEKRIEILKEKTKKTSFRSVFKVGGSIAVTLPPGFAEEGEIVTVTQLGDDIVVSKPQIEAIVESQLARIF